MIKIHEGGPTGIRDNFMMHPICDITNLDMSKLMGFYRKDPYDKDFMEGNRMNLSERAEFDYLFPFHPLSIIRNEIRPSVLKTIEFR